MANIILIKRGRASNISSAKLQEGELAIAYSDDGSAAKLYAGAANGMVLLTSDTASEITSAVSEANDYTDTKISELVDGAPAAMDTLKELADAISSNSDIMTALQSAVGNKVDKENGKGLSTNDYTTAEKTKLAGISTGANYYTHPLSHSADMITTSLSKQFVSSTEKSEWNAKLSETSTINGGTF